MNFLFSCIGRRGYVAEWFREHLGPKDRIIGTSNSTWTTGLRACDLAVLMPDVASDEYIPAMLDLCRREGVGALLSFFDEDVVRLAQHRHRFVELGVKPFLPEAAIADLCLDKAATARFLSEHGIGAPATYLSLEDTRVAIGESRLTFPIVVKPRFGAGSRNIFVARDDRELEAFFGLEREMIAQERLDGVEHGLDILGDLTGTTIAVVVKRKIRMRAGETDQAVTVHHEATIRLGERLGALLGNIGPLDVDAFVRGDEISILELNPRFGGGYPFSHRAGAAFPAKIIAMSRGETVAPDIGSYEAGVEGLKETRVVAAYDGPLTDLR